MTTGEGQRSNLLAVGLFLSLAVNLFLAGWLVGRRPGFGPPPPPPPFDRFFNEHIRSSLSPEGAKKMEATFETMRGRFADHAKEAHESHERLTAILKADRFDPAEYIAAAKASRLEHDSDREAADEELVRAIAQLSPDDRRKLAEIRHHPPGPGPGGPGPFGGFH